MNSYETNKHDTGKNIFLKIIIALIITIFMVPFIFTWVSGTDEIDENERVMDKGDPRDNVREPIIINSGKDLTPENGTNGGNGTKDDPYIISGWDIHGVGYGHGIYIGNTTDYIIIQGNSIKSVNGGTNKYFENGGISLFNVQNVMIKDNYMIDSQGAGLFLNNTGNVIIDNNTATGGKYGFSILASYNILIRNNSLLGNQIYGLHLRFETTSISIYSNNFADNNNGGVQAKDAGYNNKWDNGGIGNYWSDMSERYPNATYDSYIWNTPYEIDIPDRMKPVQDSFPRVIPRDIKSPVIVDKTMQGPAFSGKYWEFSAQVFDDIGLKEVILEITMYEDSITHKHTMEHQGGGYWSYNLTIPDDIMGNITHTILAEDMAGNTMNTPAREMAVLDRIPPEVMEAGEPKIIAGENVLFTASSYDNIEVEMVTMQYWYGQGQKMNLTMEGGQLDHWNNFLMINNLSSNLSYIFNSSDISGNFNLSPIYTRPLFDIHAPNAVIETEEMIVLGDRNTISGNSSMDNIGIDNYTWTIEFNGTSAEIYEKWFTFHPEEPGNYRIKLKVMDQQGLTGTDSAVITVVLPAGNLTENEYNMNSSGEGRLDKDRDGWPDAIEELLGSDPEDNTSFPSDTDKDGIADALDDDDDGDGIDDSTDAFPLDPDAYMDTDRDGISDALDDDDDGDSILDSDELSYGLDPLDPFDAMYDKDGDGLTNVEEIRLGTDVNDSDTDGDGLPDGWESEHGTDPKVDDSQADDDGDGFSNMEEYENRTDPSDVNEVPNTLLSKNKTDEKESILPWVLLGLVSGLILGGLGCILTKGSGRSSNNPLYQGNGNQGENPMYEPASAAGPASGGFSGKKGYDQYQSRAQDYNSSRSNTTSGVESGDDILRNGNDKVVRKRPGGTLKKNGGSDIDTASPANHNTTRTNRIQPQADTGEDPLLRKRPGRVKYGQAAAAGSSAGSASRAQDYNSSRSNTTSARMDPEKPPKISKPIDMSSPQLMQEPGGSGSGGSGGTKAQDYNSSRSNTTASAGPAPELDPVPPLHQEGVVHRDIAARNKVSSSNPNSARRRVEVLKSNKQGDPDANRYDFGSDKMSGHGSSDGRTIKIGGQEKPYSR